MFSGADDVFNYLDKFVNLEAGAKPPSMRPERMGIIAEAAGNPEYAAPAVHIAGSKGKGSITAMVSAMLAASNLRVARYLSPHIVDGRERITLDSDFFSEEIYARAGGELFEIEQKLSDKNGSYYQKLKEVSDGSPEPTYFELLTLFYFLCAKEAKVDVLAVETGMGGRLDPTNISRSVFSVITGIELEHTDMLGDTIEKIAAEKAGIIKEGVPVIIASQEHKDGAAALAVFKRTALEKNAPLFYFPEIAEVKNISVSKDGTSFTVIDKSGRFFASPLDLNIKLSGAIQALNTAMAAFAVMGVKKQFPAITADAVKRGAASVLLPARFEKLCDSPVMIADGAHTEISIKHTLETWRAVFGEGGVLLFACATGKDSRSMARLLIPCFSNIIITMPGTYKPSEPEKTFADFLETKSALKNEGVLKGEDLPEIELIKNTGEAIKAALERAGRAGGAVLAAGSFYLAAEAHLYFKRPPPRSKLS